MYNTTKYYHKNRLSTLDIDAIASCYFKLQQYQPDYKYKIINENGWQEVVYNINGFVYYKNVISNKFKQVLHNYIIYRNRNCVMINLIKK